MTFGAIQSITQFVSLRFKTFFRITLLLLGLLIIASLFLLYVWPGNVRETNMYALYYIFNGLLLWDFTTKIPLFIFFFLGLFFSNQIKKKIVNYIGIILSVCIGISMFYGIVFGRKDLITNKVELQFGNLPKGFDNYKIVHFSDVHLGNFIGSKNLMKKVQIETEKINPDLILFTGDLVNNFSNELIGWEDVFREINKNNNSYSILGNHDYGNYSRWDSEKEKDKNFKSIVNAHQLFGFQILNNDNIKIYAESDSIYLLGVENWGHPPFPQYAELDRALIGVPEESFKILMTHDPAHWETKVAGKQNIALTLSGHTHGLQFGIITAGIPFSLSYLIRKNWGGLYKENQNFLYVNTGLGTVGLPWRLNMPAELTVIELKRIEID